ncbi:MAG: CpaF family protein [Chloroflexi bacterium]|nr:CpaF family protein [Chloroflexota bacterium]
MPHASQCAPGAIPISLWRWLAQCEDSRATAAFEAWVQRRDDAGKPYLSRLRLAFLRGERPDLGPLEALLRDENVEDIYVFGYDRVLVKPPRSNRVRPVPIRFRSEEHLRNLVYRILAQVNRRLDETSPIVDTRLPDTDHRINITIPPVSAGPWYITIRKHQESWDWVKMVEEGTADFRVLALLALAVRGGVNVLVSGATGAGKTTLLNVLGRFIPAEERVVTIEDTEELQLEEGNGGAPGRHRIQHNSELELDLRGQRHIASLLTRPAAPGQTSPVTLRDLVVASLRLSPKRIIVGEVRGQEAFDMLQALNTGHDGSICTIHASTAEQAIARLRGMLRMSGLASAGDSELDEYIGRALHLVVHTRQMADGARRPRFEVAAPDSDRGRRTAL